MLNLLDGGSGIEGVILPYSRMVQQSLLPLDQSVFNTDLYRQGLTPPQMPGDHLHPYGEYFEVAVLLLDTTAMTHN